jgi:hypothetical protein
MLLWKKWRLARSGPPVSRNGYGPQKNQPRPSRQGIGTFLLI